MTLQRTLRRLLLIYIIVGFDFASTQVSTPATEPPPTVPAMPTSTKSPNSKFCTTCHKNIKLQARTVVM